MAELLGYFAAVWGIGVPVCIVIWRISHKWPSFLRLSVRSFGIAVTIAPGVIVGEGFAIVPAIMALSYYAFQRRVNINSDVAFAYGALPLLMVWAGVALIFCLKDAFRPKSPS
jgi:hypothetical protein